MSTPEYVDPTLVHVIEKEDVRLEVWRLTVRRGEAEHHIHNFNLLRIMHGKKNKDGSQAYSKRFWWKHLETIRDVLLDLEEIQDQIQDGEIDHTLAETPPWEGERS